MRIAVSDLRPNPFRDLERYPINPDKVDTLVRSIKDTTFWDNLLVRKAPNGDDGYEIAYGHHRLQALKKARCSEIDVPVRKLDDTEMARIMAHENMEEWGHSSAIEQETVRTIVLGIGRGRINMPPINKYANKVYNAASSDPFNVTSEAKRSSDQPLYTIESLSNFLGWKEYKVRAAIGALALINDGTLSNSEFIGLSSKQAEIVADQTARVERETGQKSLARSIGKRLAGGMKKATKGRDRSGTERKLKDVTIHSAKRITDEMMGSHRRKETPKKIPPIEKFAEALCVSIGAAFPTDAMQTKLEAVTQYRDDLPKSQRNALVRALRQLAERANKAADKLGN